VAYLDRRDGAHAIVAACLDTFTGRLITTSAVITEAMHFVSAVLKSGRTGKFRPLSGIVNL